MSIARLILASMAITVSQTHALSLRLKEWLAWIKKLENKFDEPFNEELREFMKSYAESTEDVWLSDENTLGDEGRTPESDVVKMDLAMYHENFFGPNKTQVPWIITIVNDASNAEHQANLGVSQLAVSHMRLLAAEYEGRVRFAYIDHYNMEEQFYWKVMLEYWIFPNTYMIVPDGKGGYDASEMWNNMFDRLSWLEMIDNENDLRHQTIFYTFKLMDIPNWLQLKGLHFFRFQMDLWTEFTEQFIVQNILMCTLPWDGDENEDKIYYKYDLSQRWFDVKIRRDKVIDWMYFQAVFIVLLLLSLFCCISCCRKMSCCHCCCFCCKKAVVQPQDEAEKKTQ